jgi:hypothetical protein
MNPTALLFLVILAHAVARLTDRIGPTPWRRLPVGQKIVAVAAILIALFILSNPEYLAFGLLGDSAFVDLLVLLLGIQLQFLGAQGRAWLAESLSRLIHWMITPRPSYLLVLATFMLLQDAHSALARRI